MKGGVIKSLRFLFILILLLSIVVARNTYVLKKENYSNLHYRVSELERKVNQGLCK